MPIVKTSAKDQIVIPKEVREELGITPGKKVLFRIVNKHAEITLLPEDAIKAMRGLLKGGRSLSKELLAERKRDNQIDEKHTAPISDFGMQI